MESWYNDGNIPYLGNSSNPFWDSSNKGSDIANIYPTYSVTSPTHGGSKAACLKTEGVKIALLGIDKLAAASLYSGEFGDLVGTNGAWLKWGRTFVNRPTQIKGWYQYTTGKITHLGSNQPANTVTKNDNDLWSAQVVLLDLSGQSDKFIQVDNTNMSTFPDWNTDSRVVAYGKLSDDFCKQQKTSWTQFVINLEYKDLIKKPTHIIILFSSSKYGDYFTGSTSSLLYLDDLEFVYGEPNF